MKQTSIDWLKKELEQFGSSSHLDLDWDTFDELIKQAKEMHKEEIVDAYYQCGKDNFEHIKVINRSAIDYYNETYDK